ncbi:MAG: TonB-dependent receptor [Bacteroidales bacterium]|nr:TonB-dependent receptor [Bacteroidales bacterium]
MMRKATLLLVSLLSFSLLYSQEKTITGKVKDETGAGLPGATVQLKGTQTGTMTDVNGDFTLKVPATGGTLVVSYVGYTTQELAIGENTNFVIDLKPAVTELEEAVVIGYGIQKKSLVTAAITKIDSKDITSAPVARLDQAMQGKAAGVYIAQSSGAPGGSMSVKIRGNASDGSNEPIYIVNGVKVRNIDFLSPGDIESVEVLKDAASAAIYGTEGGNGVVIITTKKATKGISQVNYNYYHGWQSAAHVLKSMSAEQYIAYMKEAFKNELDNGVINQGAYDAAIAKYNAMQTSGNSTNWLDEIFGTAPMDEHNLSFNTSTDKSSYLLSASYLTQDGIVGGDKANFTRYTFTLNNSNQIKDWLNIETNLTYSKSKRNNLNENSDFGNGIINSALYFDPTIPVYYKDETELPVGWRPNDPGTIYPSLVKTKDGKIFHNSTETMGDVANPMAIIYMTKNTTQRENLLGNIKTEISLPFKLKFTNLIGLDYGLVNDDIFTPRYFFDATNSQTNDSLVSLKSSFTKYYKYNFDNYVTFNFSLFEDLNFDGLLGTSYENSSPYYLTATGYKFPYGSSDYAYLYNNQSGSDPVISGGYGSEGHADSTLLLASYFGRLSANYKELIMGQVNFRRDGSSLFGPNHKFAYFPSFSVGVNFYKFLQTPMPFLSNGKLRYSWGENGNQQNLGMWAYTSTIRQFTAYTDASGNALLGAIPRRPANPDLVWETSRQHDVGMDLGFFANRLTFTVDYFYKTTVDQINVKAKDPYYHGFQSPPIENNGKILNKGWEFDLTYREAQKEFKYSITANASYLSNKVLSYGSAYKDGYRMNVGDFVTRYQPGYPVWYFIGLKAEGVFQTKDEINSYTGRDSSGNAILDRNGNPVKIQPKAIPGDVKYADLNKNGKIDDGDRTYIGKPLPDWMFGLNFSCNYKWFDFSIFFQGVTGNQIFFSAIQVSRPQYNKPEFYYTERWTGPGTSNKFPRATYKDNNNNFRASTLNIHNGDYLRLKNISFGITLPESLVKKAGIQKLRLYVTAANLITWTKYKGNDPEVGRLFDTQSNNSYGVDRGLYPQPRLITTGLNLTF